MATLYQVTGVRTEQSPTGYHDHISYLRVGVPGFMLSRQTVVNDIRNPVGDRYYTQVNGRRANVVVVSCSQCSFSDYLRTDADTTTTNNLLSLPRV